MNTFWLATIAAVAMTSAAVAQDAEPAKPAPASADVSETAASPANVDGVGAPTPPADTMSAVAGGTTETPVYAPKCSKSELKELLGEKATSVKKGTTPDSYLVEFAPGMAPDATTLIMNTCM